MREDFLTIPDAPNYEINSELICRNKKTGRLLKKCSLYGQEANFTYSLRVNKVGRRVRAITLRNKAEAAVETMEWLPVPSLGYLYELNKRGALRNIKTKLRNKNIGGCYWLTIDKENVVVSKTSLLWEVFGILPKNNRLRRQPCIVSKGNQRYHFDSLTEAAKFLAPKIFYSLSQVKYYFWQRKTYIFGWRINYLEEEMPNHVRGLA